MTASIPSKPDEAELLRRIERARVVKIDHASGHLMASRVIGEDAYEISALACADAQNPNRARSSGIEIVPYLVLHGDKATRHRGACVVVPLMPFRPVVRSERRLEIHGKKCGTESPLWRRLSLLWGTADELLAPQTTAGYEAWIIECGDAQSTETLNRIVASVDLANLEDPRQPKGHHNQTRLGDERASVREHCWVECQMEKPQNSTVWERVSPGFATVTEVIDR